LVAVNGTLYGATSGGGEHSVGTVFSVTRSGHERLLHSFALLDGGGFFPDAGLVYSKGYLYGTTNGGGSSAAGVVFRTTLSGKVETL
jgi:uncharacterized repeat protein (TIGR03803 family)